MRLDPLMAPGCCARLRRLVAAPGCCARSWLLRLAAAPGCCAWLVRLTTAPGCCARLLRKELAAGAGYCARLLCKGGRGTMLGGVLWGLDNCWRLRLG